MQKLQGYITDYIQSDKRKTSDLFPLNKLVQQQKYQEIMNRYEDLYSLELFEETIEDSELLSKARII